MAGKRNVSRLHLNESGNRLHLDTHAPYICGFEQNKKTTTGDWL